MKRGKASWRRRGCYVWRTRKPHAVIGLPIVGRHVGYVGETNNRYFRDRQHKHGDSRYSARDAAWSDLEPKVYPLPCLFPSNALARKTQETFWIWLLCPVYNEQKQPPYNVRRIRKHKAQQLRWKRDETGRKFNVTRVAIRYAMYLLFLFLVGFSGYWEVMH